jgi:hypothetical protein
MHLPVVLKDGFKLLPPAFREAYKSAVCEMGYAMGERDKLRITVNGVELTFNMFWAQQISHLQLNYIARDANEAMQKEQLPTLVISPVIYPKIAKKLLDLNVNYIDQFGNVYINEKTIYLQSSGKKVPSGKKMTKSRLFGETGLKLLFVLLQDQEAVNFPYRDIAKLVNISPASITILFKEMIREGYLLEDYDDSKRLLRKRELLDRWVNGYKEILRPKLMIGTFKSVKKDLVRNFRALPIIEWHGSWGNEPAGSIYTNYLSPELLTMYVTEDGKPWMKSMSLIPTNDGKHEIEVLKYFWNKDHPLFMVEPNTVPPLLAYAELVETGDSRNFETAQKIYDEYLQFIEQ